MMRDSEGESEKGWTGKQKEKENVPGLRDILATLQRCTGMIKEKPQA